MVRKKKQLNISTKSNDTIDEYIRLENEEESVEDDVIRDPVKVEVEPVDVEVKQETVVESAVVEQELKSVVVEPEVKPVESEVKPILEPKVKQEVESEVKQEVEADVKQEVESEVKQEVEAEVKPVESEVKQVESQVKQVVEVKPPVVEPEVNPVVEPEVKPVESEVKPVVEPEVKTVVEPEVKTVVEPEVKQVESQVKQEVEPEVKPVVEPEVKQVKSQVKQEVEPEVKTVEPEVNQVESQVKPVVEPEVKQVESQIKQEVEVKSAVVEAEVKPVDNIKYSDLLNNRNNIDYTKDILNGYYCNVIASETVNQYMCVERLIIDGNLRVKHTDNSCRNLFLGIAQNNASPGEVVNVLINGISIINVRKNINLPVLNRNNGQITTIRDKYGKVSTQSVSIPVNKTDLLVLAGTNSDILAGPLTQYYQYNLLGNEGMLTPYKSIQLNSNNLSYTINYTEQNNILGQKNVGGNKFIQVLDINIQNGEMIGYLC